MIALAVAVAATARFAPGHRTVNEALENFSIEEAASGEAPIVRPPEPEDVPYIPPPPDQKAIEALKPRPSVITYVVQPGDTVNKIAGRYNITPSTVVWANNLANPDKLPVGQALLILPMSGVLHTLQPGETLDQVAQEYQIDPKALADANGLALDKALPPSHQLVIPGGRPLDPPRVEPSARAVERPDPNAARPSSGAPAATQATPPPTPAPIKPVVYEVQAGDTVLSIAQKFGVSAGTVVQANGIAGTAADSLQVGQKLRILPVDGVIHKVAEGDMVRDIAAYYGVDTQAIIKANGLVEPYFVQPGQELVVPGGKIPDQPTPAPAPAAPPAPEATPIPYTVADGDSVVSIAERYGLEPRLLARYNGLDNADLIAPGQSLFLPPGARLVTAGAAQPRSASVQAAPPQPAPAQQPVAAPPPRQQNPLQVAASIVRPIVAPAAPPPPPAPKPVVPSNNWNLVSIASKYLGYAYTWGGASPRTGFDCSGFTWYVYQQAGKSIPNHDLWGQLQSGTRISRANLQAGDLVFFQNTYMPGLSHVGIYIGGGRFINAQSERAGVTVASLSDPFWASRYVGASRP
jgi:peptidoglycan endopeptidase LytE